MRMQKDTRLEKEKTDFTWTKVMLIFIPRKNGWKNIGNLSQGFDTDILCSLIYSNLHTTKQTKT